jgi:hypothetical protein
MKKLLTRGLDPKVVKKIERETHHRKNGKS